MLINEMTQPVIEGVYDPQIFKAVFMAGSPGAGKSTVSHALFSGTGLKVLNVDAFWHLYKAKGKTNGNYEKYWDHYKGQEELFKYGRLGLIIDGTAKNPARMAQVKADLEELGYDTAMIFVNTSLETSLQRVGTRAASHGKDQGRTIDPEFVKDTWEKTQRGLGSLQAMFDGNFYIVDNNRGSPNLQYVKKAMNKWLSTPSNKPAAREWMQKQMELKRGQQNADQ